MWARRDLKSRLLTYARRAFSLFLVLIATLAGGYLAIVGYDQTRELSVGEIRMSVSPGHRGALDVYVPLVDWGARFEAIKAPIRIRVDLQTVNRQVATSLAEGEPLNVEQVREEATAALTDYIKRLIVFAVLGAAALGLLVAFAIRSQVPRLRRTIPFSITIAVGIGVAMVIFIPPRGEIANPQYYAHGPDIPRALEAVEAARRTSGVLDQELDAQLVGLAKLVIDPGLRQSLEGRPVITVASDLHNNPFGARRAGADRRRRPGVLRRRPHRPRLPARDAAGAPRRAHRQAVRVRLGQPRLRLPQPRPGGPGRGRAHAQRPAQARRRPTGR